MATRRICSIPDCGKRHMARGLCKPHYEKASYHRQLPPRPPRTDWERVGAIDTKHFIEQAVSTKTDDCILWPLSKSHNGYGLVVWKGKRWRAHRLTCTIVHGSPSRPDLVAMHSCRNRACINPGHLRWGTIRENVHDAISCGTFMGNLPNSKPKLDEKTVREIRQSAEPNTVLAAKLGVSHVAIWKIRHRITWKDVV